MSKISDERREVAARLRERAQLSNFCPFESFFVRLNVIIFGDNGWDRTDGGVLERLADLIDPTCQVSSIETYCDELGQSDGWKFHLTCGHSVHYEEPSYCPDCGARVVSHDDN